MPFDPFLRCRYDGARTLIAVLRDMPFLTLIQRLSSDGDDPALAADISEQLADRGFAITALPCAVVLPFPRAARVIQPPCDVEPGPETAA